MRSQVFIYNHVAGSVIAAASTPAHRAGAVLHVLLLIVGLIAVIAVGAGAFWLAHKIMPIVIGAACLCGILLLIGWIFNSVELMKISGITGGCLIAVAIVSELMVNG